MKFLLPSDEDTILELSFPDSDKCINNDIVELDILHSTVRNITAGTDNFYPMFLTEFEKEFGAKLTKGQAYAIINKKRQMFEELKKNCSLLEEEYSGTE